MHPGCLVASKEVEYGVGDLKIMFGTVMKKQSAVAVAIYGPGFAQYSFPGGTVLSNSPIKVTKNNEFICSGKSGDNIFKDFIEMFFCLICVGYGGCIDTDNGSELFSRDKVEVS